MMILDIISIVDRSCLSNYDSTTYGKVQNLKRKG